MANKNTPIEQLKPCGTVAAYARHIRRKEKPCIACSEAKRLDSKLEYLLYPERVNIRTSKWKKKNKEKVLQQQRERNALIPKEVRKQKKREYRLKNLEKVRRIARECERRRKAAKLKVVVNKYTEQEVLERYSNNCFICGKEINLNANRKPGSLGWEYGLHIDHLIPLSKNGSDSIENVRPTHGLCNIKKHDKEFSYVISN